MPPPTRTIAVGVAELETENPHFELAAVLAERLGAVLHVIHAFSPADPVLTPTGTVPAPSSRQQSASQADVQSRLEAWVAARSPNGAIVCHAVSMSPGAAILSVADQVAADLIIVGASRRAALATAVLGTTAQRVLRASPVPVLVNRRLERQPPRRILLTTDLSEISSRVHRFAIPLVKTLWSSPDVHLRSLLVAGDDVLLPPPLVQIPMREFAESRLGEFLRELSDVNHEVEGRVRLGLTAREIVAEAEAWHADLLVLGTQGRSGFSRFLIGSVAETVSRKAPCDVLVLPVAALEGTPGLDDAPA
jgi:nucleotide-binding universal stress UspA family protein